MADCTFTRFEQFMNIPSYRYVPTRFVGISGAVVSDVQFENIWQYPDDPVDVIPFILGACISPEQFENIYWHELCPIFSAAITGPCFMVLHAENMLV